MIDDARLAEIEATLETAREKMPHRLNRVAHSVWALRWSEDVLDSADVLLARVRDLEEIADAALHYLDDPHEESGRTLAALLDRRGVSSAASGEERNG